MPEKINVGLIGCGAISGAYLKHAQSFPILDIVACADINLDAAKQKAQEFGVPRACTVGQLLKDDSIEIVLNLTIPRAHAPVALKAIKAGKHTYCEKPLGIGRKEGQRVLEA